MANIIIRKKGNNLNSFKVAVYDLYLDEVKTTLDFTDTEKTIPMPDDTDEIGGVMVTLATGVTATEIKVNVYKSAGTIYHTFSVPITSTGIKKGDMYIDSDTTIFEIECNTPIVVPPEKEKLTITKGDFATNSGKYSVQVGADMNPITATLGFNDETITVDKPSDFLEFSSVYVSFNEGVIFESGYVEIYDKNKTLLITYPLKYGSTTKTASYYSGKPDTSLMLIYIKFHELPTPDVVPTFNHTYNMLPAELEQLVIEGLGVPTPAGTLDLRGFMLNLLSLPLAVPPDLLGEKQPIVLGDYTRKTTATTVKGDVLTYNVGSIKVPQKYNNAYDFYTAETTLILPYTENIQLPPEYVIGATISIEYVVEVYKGTVNINVKSSKTDKPIYNGTTAIGRQIPFISYWKILGDESIYTSVYNNQTKATIEVKRKPPLQLENGLDTSEYGTIGDFKGYVETTEVTLVGSTMGGYEQEQLISILNKGVIL